MVGEMGYATCAICSLSMSLIGLMQSNGGDLSGLQTLTNCLSLASVWFFVTTTHVFSCYSARVYHSIRVYYALMVYCLVRYQCLDKGSCFSGHPLKMMEVVAVVNAGPGKPLRLLFCNLNRLYGSVWRKTGLRFWSCVNTWSLLHRKAPWHFQHYGWQLILGFGCER